MANHKWKKDSTQRHTYVCVNCGIEKDTTSSHVFYLNKQGETFRERPKCNGLVEIKPNAKAALKYAINAIYFNDNSDYLTGLYGVVRSLTGFDEPNKEDITKLFKELN